MRRRPDEIIARAKPTSQRRRRRRRVKVVNLWKIHARRPPPTLTSKTYSTKMPRYLPPSVFVAICIFSLSDAFVPANKITPAEPPLRPTWTLARGIGSSRSSTTTALNAKKKNTASAASSKIQVKMLKHVEGTGHVRTSIFSLLFCLCVTFFVFFSYHLLLPQCTFINISTLPHI